MKFELYHFKRGDVSWYFTNSKRNISHDGITYKSIPAIDRTDIEDEDLNKASIDIVFPNPYPLLNSDNESLDELFNRKIYFDAVTVTLYELEDNETLVLFKGRVTQPRKDYSSNTLTLSCSTSDTLMRRNILTRKVQRTCANVIYDKFCGLNFFDRAYEAEVTAISDRNIEFDYVLPEPTPDPEDPEGEPIESEPIVLPDGYFNRGLILSNGVYTFILSSGQNVLTLYREHIGLKVGDIILIADGCDQTRRVCDTVFNNHKRYNGHLNVPSENPVYGQLIK